MSSSNHEVKPSVLKDLGGFILKAGFLFKRTLPTAQLKRPFKAVKKCLAAAGVLRLLSTTSRIYYFFILL